MSQRRIYQCAFPYFITFNTYNNQRFFENVQNAEIMHQMILRAGIIKNHWIFQFCIMPDHIHILCQTKPPSPPSNNPGRADSANNITLGRADFPVRDTNNPHNKKHHCDCRQYHQYHISDFVKCVRGSFSRKIGKRNLWQPRYYDQILHRKKQLKLVIKYIEENPIKAGLSDVWQKKPYQFKSDPLINKMIFLR